MLKKLKQASSLVTDWRLLVCACAPPADAKASISAQHEKNAHEAARKVSLINADVALRSFVLSSSQLLLPWLTMTTAAQ